MNFGLLLLFYGLYFGVVSRDFSETCTEMMAASLGVSTSIYSILSSVKIDLT